MKILSDAIRFNYRFQLIDVVAEEGVGVVVEHLARVVGGRGLREGLGEADEGAGVDLGDDVVEVLEVMVERAGGVADGATKRAGREGVDPLLRDQLLGGVDDEAGEFALGVIGTSGHYATPLERRSISATNVACPWLVAWTGG